MPDITLTEVQQRALRLLIAAEPVPGHRLPQPHVLEQVTTLVPCDGVVAGVADSEGYVLDSVDVHRSRPGSDRVADVVLLRYGTERDLVVQLALDRRGRRFNAHDLAVLRLLQPVLQRLLRQPPLPHLPGDLTVQERRVLQQVALGRTNAEIAETLGVAPCTVRKHLEHAFPKLGVTNRLAAAMAFEGREQPDPERADRVEIFA